MTPEQLENHAYYLRIQHQNTKGNWITKRIKTYYLTPQQAEQQKNQHDTRLIRIDNPTNFIKGYQQTLEEQKKQNKRIYYNAIDTEET